jgi:hypothetical protein
MKRILVILAVTAFFAAPALSQGVPPAVGSYEVEAWVCDTIAGTFTPIVPDRMALARCWASGDAEGDCNKRFWTINVFIHASVAQWIDWEITGTRWDWYVRKPGCYAANCITANVKSNGDVGINYDGFEDLKALIPNMHNEYIKIWYGFGTAIGLVQFIPALLLNDDDDILDETELNQPGHNLHEGITWKLWNKICVDNCNTACEYTDEATLTLVLLEQKPWISVDPDDGYFIAGFPGP